MTLAEHKAVKNMNDNLESIAESLKVMANFCKQQPAKKKVVNTQQGS